MSEMWGLREVEKLTTPGMNIIPVSVILPQARLKYGGCNTSLLDSQNVVVPMPTKETNNGF